MRVVTNHGSNLSAAQVAHYNLALTPQHITADGVRHATGAGMTIDDVDRLVATSKEHPYILGTSAAEFVSLFRELAATDRELIVVTNSKKVIGSYDASIAATRALSSVPSLRDTQVTTMDTLLADQATGYLTCFVAESLKMKKPVSAIADAVNTLGSKSCTAFVPKSMDYLAKSGRASFLKSMAANLLQKVPIIGLREGEMGSIGTLSRTSNIPEGIAASLKQQVPPGGKFYVGISHGRDTAAAEELAGLLRKQYDVYCMAMRTWAPSIYLNVGESVGAFVIPLSMAPWMVDIFMG